MKISRIVHTVAGAAGLFVGVFTTECLAKAVKGAESTGSWLPVEGLNASPDILIEFDIHFLGKDEPGFEAKFQEIAKEGKGNWLKLDELKAYVEPTHEAKDAVLQFMTSNGTFEIEHSFNELGNKLHISMSLDKCADIFQASFAAYKGSKTTGGEEETIYRARDGFVIPDCMENYVHSVTGFAEFPTWTIGLSQREPIDVPAPALGKRQYDDCKAPNVMTPECVLNLYGIPKEPPGKPTDPAMGIVGPSPSDFSDHTFRKFAEFFDQTHRLDGYTFQVIMGPGAVIDPRSASSTEVRADTQCSASILAPVPGKVYILKLGPDFVSDAINYFAGLPEEELPSVISMSFGAEEAQVTPGAAEAMCRYAIQLTSRGTTIIVSSGDTGVGGLVDPKTKQPPPCPPFRPTYPSGCEYIVSVGATKSVNPEVSPNLRDDTFSSSGGFSKFFKRPIYQETAINDYFKYLGMNESGNYERNGRGFPDISATGTNLPVVDLTDQAFLNVGTSISAPVFAAMLAQINGARIAAGFGRIGWLNYYLYDPNLRRLFYEVTEGFSGDCFTGLFEHGFGATPGWDASNGWGTPNFNEFLDYFTHFS